MVFCEIGVRDKGTFVKSKRMKLFLYNYDVMGKKKATVLTVSTIREQDKKNVEFNVGDYYTLSLSKIVC